MTTESEYAVDRTGWPSGPWDGEPDKVQFRTRAGLPGLIVRSPLGVLCGYVAVPKGHPFYDRTEWESGLCDLRVHGGVTYTAKCGNAVCHVPEPGEPDDVWWIGFDTSHASDVAPPVAAILPRAGRCYRDLAYVRGHVEGLADQLAAIAKRAPDAGRP